jgi:predicted ATPase/class 3 adenylate cyclase
MSIQCPRCQAMCRAGARFCDQCGVAIGVAGGEERRAPRPELRQGTLLFCDLVQSTELANHLDHDDLRLVFSSIHRIVREVSRRHSGYVIRFVGDGAFVAFGYPAAQEDSAESAVRAGLDLTLSIRSIRPAPPAMLELRVGIASGTVAMGEMIDGAAIDEQSVSGRAVHLAARLAAAAPPGAVIICDDTRRVIGQRFALDRLEPLTLKGFAAPIQAWRALSEKEPMSRFDAHRPSAGMGQMVGRDGVLMQLADLWSKALGGAGQAVQLVGDAGIGKSRLIHALALLIADSRPQQLDLHCTPHTSNSPLFPVAVLLRRLADVQLGDDEAICMEKAAVLLATFVAQPELDAALRYLGPLFCRQASPTAEVDSPELVRERTIALLVELVGALVARGPVLLLVEDLHWSDATTKLLLQRLLAAVPKWPMFVVITTRDAEPGPALVPLDVPSLRLGPLDDGDSRRLVRHAWGEQPSDDAVEWIVDRAEGNPLFLEELTLAMRESGVAVTGEAVQPTPESIPATLQNIIQARLDRLPALKPLVQAASVLGREFSWRLLASLTDDEADIAAPIGTLIEHEILVATGAASQGALRFKHALIHEAVYNTILRGERQRLHGRTADLLGGPLGESAESSPDLLAHHLSHAGRPADAIRCLTEASRETASRAAYQESIGHTRAGLRLLPQVADESLRRSLHLVLVTQLGLSLTATLGYADPSVEETYAQAFNLCDDATDPAEAYPIVRGLGTYYLVRGRIAKADALALQCIDLARRADRSDLMIDAHSFAAFPALYRGRLGESQRAVQESLDLYEAERGERFTYPNAQDPATAAWSLLTTAAWMRGELHVADAAAKSLLAHVQRLARPFDTTFGTVWLSASCQLQRRFQVAVEHGQAGLAIAQKHGFGTWIPAAMMQICIGTGGRTASAESIATLQAVHQAFINAGAEVSATFYLWGIAQAMIIAGDVDSARAVLAEGLRRVDAGDETYMKAELLILLATIETDQEAAAAHLAAALEHAQEQEALTVALRAACRLAIVSDPTTPLAARARDALAILDGERTYPDDRDWVAATFNEFRAALQSALNRLPATLTSH